MSIFECDTEEVLELIKQDIIDKSVKRLNITGEEAKDFLKQE